MSAVSADSAAQRESPAPGSAAPALELIEVHKWFHRNHVLDGIDLTVPRGEKIAIIGPSGSGKSTLLRTLNRLERIDSGILNVLGRRIGVERRGRRLREASDNDLRIARQRLGMVFQNFNLFPHMTAAQNIAFAPIRNGKLSAPQAAERARELLQRVGLAEKAEAYPGQLSGGQQQRVAIARALAQDPELLLFDEPTSALDPELVGEVLSVIKDLASQRTTVLIVTHEIGFARDIADRVVFMADGRIVESGTPDTVLRNPRNPRTRSFLERVLS